MPLLSAMAKTDNIQRAVFTCRVVLLHGSHVSLQWSTGVAHLSFTLTYTASVVKIVYTVAFQKDSVAWQTRDQPWPQCAAVEF
jgi:hypothetical protein